MRKISYKSKICADLESAIRETMRVHRLDQEAMARCLRFSCSKRAKKLAERWYNTPGNGLRNLLETLFGGK